MATGKCILLIDDHDIFRRGLRTLLGECCPEACVLDAASLAPVTDASLPAPDMVLLDIKLPGASELDGIALIKERWPQAVVAVLSSLDGFEAESEALAREAAASMSMRQRA